MPETLVSDFCDLAESCEALTMPKYCGGKYDGYFLERQTVKCPFCCKRYVVSRIEVKGRKESGKKPIS